jgi:hypothetical protein
MDEDRVDCVRARFGVDGTILIVWPPSRDTGRAEDVSSERCIRARLAGAVFSSLSGRAGVLEAGSTVVSSLSSNFALD